jgi:hypothetical protein
MRRSYVIPEFERLKLKFGYWLNGMLRELPPGSSYSCLSLLVSSRSYSGQVYPLKLPRPQDLIAAEQSPVTFNIFK